MKQSPKIVDTFLFHNELDLLDIRLNELNPHVDLFILVEANTTFSGQPKEYSYEENKDRFEQFKDKILHIKIEDMPSFTGPGDLRGEHYQRTAIGDTIHYLHSEGQLGLEDVVFMSDVDEIPFMADLLVEMEHGIDCPSVLNMDSRLYHINRSRDARWKGTVICMVRDMVSMGSQEIRDNRFEMTTIWNGWHFSYLGGLKSVIQKIESLADAPAELNKSGVTMEDVQKNVESGQDPFGRTDYNVYTVHELDMPKYVVDNPTLYPDFIYAK